jgi:hypothetical protein
MSICKSASRPLFCALLAMMFLSAPAYSQQNLSQVEKDKRMEFEFRYWFANSRASVNATENGREAGVRAGLDLNSKGAVEARYSWRFTGRHKLKIDYAQLSTVSGTADFALNPGGGNSLSADNIDLSSLGSAEMDIKQFKIGYTWQGIKLGNRIRLGPLVDVRGILFDASFTPSSSGADDLVERRSGIFGLGMLTLGTEVSAALNRRAEITSTLSFIPIAGLGRVFEAETTAKLSLSNHFNLSLGYRYLRMRAGEGPNFAEFRQRGPAVGAGFRF